MASVADLDRGLGGPDPVDDAEVPPSPPSRVQPRASSAVSGPATSPVSQVSASVPWTALVSPFVPPADERVRTHEPTAPVARRGSGGARPLLDLFPPALMRE